MLHMLRTISSCQCLFERKLEAINRLDNKTTMNKFISFLVAILVVAKVSPFMGQSVFSQQRLVTNLVAVMLIFFPESQWNVDILISQNVQLSLVVGHSMSCE